MRIRYSCALSSTYGCVRSAIKGEKIKSLFDYFFSFIHFFTSFFFFLRNVFVFNAITSPIRSTAVDRTFNEKPIPRVHKDTFLRALARRTVITFDPSSSSSSSFRRRNNFDQKSTGYCHYCCTAITSGTLHSHSFFDDQPDGPNRKSRGRGRTTWKKGLFSRGSRAQIFNYREAQPAR